jgi:hypothetical protein
MQLVSLGSDLAEDGIVTLPNGVSVLLKGDKAGCDSQDKQNGEDADRSSFESLGSLLLADIVAFELVFGDAVHRCREGGYLITKMRIAQSEITFVPCPCHVEVQGLRMEYSVQYWVHGGRSVLIEVVRLCIPGPCTVGEDGQDSFWSLGCHPVLDLLAHPVGASGFWGTEQNEPSRPIQSGAYARPESGADGESRLVSKYFQGAASVPGLGEPLKAILQCGSKGPVSTMRVRDKSGVPFRRSLRLRWIYSVESVDGGRLRFWLSIIIHCFVHMLTDLPTYNKEGGSRGGLATAEESRRQAQTKRPDYHAPNDSKIATWLTLCLRARCAKSYPATSTQTSRP